MRIMTCNIRTSVADDGANAWPFRKGLCCEVIRRRDPALICFQEVQEDQFADLVSAFGEFDAYGVPDVPLGRDPVNSIFFRRDLFRLVSAGTFWLSGTPHVPGSSSWESACVRLAGWVRLERRDSKTECAVVNTHLDHRSREARENQARLINEWAAAFGPEFPMILTGDMNCDRTSAAIRSFGEASWRDSYEAAHGPADPGFTFHFFRGVDYVSDPATRTWWPEKQGKVDWIFVRGPVRVTGAEVVRDSQDGRYPSDHYFVSADLAW